MSRFNDSLEDRRKAAEQARLANLKRFATRPSADDPAMKEKQAAGQAVQEARTLRQAEAAVKKEAERLAKAKQAEEDALLEEQRKVDAAAQDEALKIAQKAARDARYAARKARK